MQRHLNHSWLAYPRLVSVTVFLTGLMAFASDAPGADPATKSEIEKPGAEAGKLIAPEFSTEDQKFYTDQVKPILVKHCYNCHSHAGGEASGELVVDSRNSILKGGDRGPAIVPGDPAKSLLLSAISYKDKDLQMPEKGKLEQADIETLTEWVKRGAPWDKETLPTGKMTARPRGKITDEDRAYWAFQPPKSVEPPTIQDERWNKNPIDKFVHQKRTAAGLPAAPRAEAMTLLRRVYQDLIGLPPTLAEQEAYLQDTAPGAYERVVDKLLASPQYGERWARHWFDVVRFAESDGYRLDEFRKTAWHYRDYVIKSFNDDKPYDQFVREQLAADEFAPNDPASQPATGFLRLGIYEYNNRDAEGQWTLMLNEITDVTADVFLGLGMGCARCHDHKFDPILQKDYFRLQAFFAGIDMKNHDPLATKEQVAEYNKQLKLWEEKTSEIRAKIDAFEEPMRKKMASKAIEMFPSNVKRILKTDYAKLNPYEQQIYNLSYRQVEYEYGRIDSKFKDEEKKQLVELKKELDKFNGSKPQELATTLTTTDIGPQAPPITIPKRGKEPVEPGFLTVLDPNPAKIPEAAKDQTTTGRRAALAKWLTDPQNPLTARVMVNRVWQGHFGRGIVPTTSDFGNLSEKPSHPELLDWLTVQFVEHGWQLKWLHRLIVTSETYCQSSLVEPSELAIEKDSDNRLLWRMNTRRLDSEQIRDAILVASGKLSDSHDGPSSDASSPRRTIFTKTMRNSRDPLLEVFDTPDGFLSMPQRNITVSPSQSLLLINSPQMLKISREFASRLEKDFPKDLDARIRAAYRSLYTRDATSDELALARKFISVQRKQITPIADPGSNFQYAKMPYREGRAAVLAAGNNGPKLMIPEDDKFPTTDFTIEGFVILRSMFEDGTVRTIASQGNGDSQRPGWAFGVTSKRSRYKPQVLVLQLFGNNEKGVWENEPVFSNLHIELDKPYYVGVSVKLDETGKQGITFYAKDLSNDDEQMQLSQVAHKVVSIASERGPLALGMVFGAKGTREWDGLIDDVRLSRTALKQEQLLLTQENSTADTVGLWQFEMQPGMFQDTSGNKRHMNLDMGNKAGNAVKQAANSGEKADKNETVAPSSWADYCHVLLNTSEFLYVD
jgi:hypothetical protein